MAENRFTLRGLSDRTLTALDKIAKDYGCTRNELICNVLEKYVADKDNFILNNLPSVVRSMAEQELRRISGSSDELIRDIYQVLLRLVRTSQVLENFLYPELSKIDTGALDTKDLLAILDSIDGTSP